MPATGKVASSTGVSATRSSTAIVTLLGAGTVGVSPRLSLRVLARAPAARHAIQLDQLGQDRLLLPRADPARDAPPQVLAHQQRLEALQRSLDGIRLAEHVHAVGLRLDHAAHPLQVPLDIGQPLERLAPYLLVHRSLPPRAGVPRPPYGGFKGEYSIRGGGCVDPVLSSRPPPPGAAARCAPAGRAARPRGG